MERREFLAVAGGVVMGATVPATGGRAVGRSQTPSLSPAVFTHRIERLQEELKRRKLDLLVAEPSTNFQYFTGYNPGRSERLILLMLPAAGNPVVVGSRIRGSIERGAMSNANLLGNRLLSGFASLLFRTRISDVCSGMWAFDSGKLKSLGLTAEGFELEADIFAECSLQGIPIVEIPIPYSKRIGEPKLRLREGLRIAFALLRKRIHGKEPRPVEPIVAERTEIFGPAGPEA